MMPSYYQHSNLTAYLVIICNAGQNPLVPCFWSNLALDIWPDKTHDTLLLHRICLGDIGTDKDQYRQCLIRFLQDPQRSGKYAIGTDTYTNAALFFLHKLKLRPCRETNNDHDDEHYFSKQLTLENGIWRCLPCQLPERVYSTNRDYYPLSVSRFIYLGYLIFCLPQAGKSVSLVRHCQQQSFLTKAWRICFPERVALVQQAMKEYLERCGCAVDLTTQSNSLLE